MASSVPAAAPWRETFLSHIKQMESPTFVFSTLHPVDASLTVPRCRTVVFRGLWAELPVNPKNTAELNPRVFESDLLTLTSDARMDKVPELFRSASGEEELQSGGGGPAEAVFWAVEPRTQWRLRGRAYVIGPDIDAAAAAPVRRAVQDRMRATGTGTQSDFGWSRELTAHFGNLSPGMRGTFRNPPPGTPLSQKPDEGLGRGQKVQDLHDEIARNNFRVVVVVPDEVDQVDLTDPAEARRWNYTYTGATSEGSWKTTELWP